MAYLPSSELRGAGSCRTQRRRLPGAAKTRRVSAGRHSSSSPSGSFLRRLRFRHAHIVVRLPEREGHGGIFRKIDVVAACDEIAIDGAARSEGAHGHTEWLRVNGETERDADQFVSTGGAGGSRTRFAEAVTQK